MSNQSLNTKPTYLKLEKLELINSIPLHIPDDVLNKIKFLCKTISKDEWSGVIFYEVEGSIKKASTVKLTIRDLFLMDKGTPGATEFDWSEDIVAYRMEHPETLDMRIGHIHSHNTMAVFFSGTDWSELNDNCPQHDYYLSVIVNNYMDVQAKIAFAAKQDKFTCKDEEGKDFMLTLTKAPLNPMMFVYNCSIHTSVESLSESEEFIARIKAVEEDSEKRKIAKTIEYAKTWQPQNNSTQAQIGYGGIKNPVVNGQYGDWSSKAKDKKKDNKNWDKSKENEKSAFPSYDPEQKSHRNIMLDGDTNEERDTPSIDEEFAAYLIRLGLELDGDTLNEALYDVDFASINTEVLINTIIREYTASYNDFFFKLKAYHNPESYMNVLEKIIDLFQKESEEYSFVMILVEELKAIGNEFEMKLQNNKFKNEEEWNLSS